MMPYIQARYVRAATLVGFASSLLGGAILASTAGTARSQSYVDVQTTNYSACAGCPAPVSQSYDTGAAPNSVTSPVATLNISTGLATANSSASGTAALGTLSGNASGVAQILDTDPTDLLNDYLYTEGYASATSVWVDTFTPMSVNPALPIGTPTQLLATINLTGNFTGFGGVLGETGAVTGGLAIAQLSQLGASGPLLQAQYTLDSQISTDARVLTGAQVPINVVIGEPITLEGQLFVAGAGVTDNGNTTGTFALGPASGSSVAAASFNIDPTAENAAGIYYQTTSGKGYYSPSLLQSLDGIVHQVWEHLQDAGKVDIVAGYTATALAYAMATQPELAPLSLWLLVNQPVLIEAGEILNGPDPPLPTISAGGLVGSQLATDLNKAIQNEQQLVELTSTLSSEIQAIQTAVNNTDTEDEYVNEISFMTNETTFASLSKEQSTLLNQIVQEMLAAGIPNVSISQQDLLNYVNSLETNGFPPDETAYFNDLGLTQADINALLADLPTLNFTDAPDTLYSFFNEDALVHAELASVPEPASLALFAPALLGLAFFYRRKRLS